MSLIPGLPGTRESLVEIFRPMPVKVARVEPDPQFPYCPRSVYHLRDHEPDVTLKLLNSVVGPFHHLARYPVRVRVARVWWDGAGERLVPFPHNKGTGSFYVRSLTAFPFRPLRLVSLCLIRLAVEVKYTLQQKGQKTFHVAYGTPSLRKCTGSSMPWLGVEATEGIVDN